MMWPKNAVVADKLMLNLSTLAALCHCPFEALMTESLHMSLWSSLLSFINDIDKNSKHFTEQWESKTCHWT